MKKKIISIATEETLLEIEMETTDVTAWKENVCKYKYYEPVSLLDDETLEVTEWWSEIEGMVSDQTPPPENAPEPPFVPE